MAHRSNNDNVIESIPECIIECNNKLDFHSHLDTYFTLFCAKLVSKRP